MRRGLFLSGTHDRWVPLVLTNTSVNSPLTFLIITKSKKSVRALRYLDARMVVIKNTQ